MNATPLSGTDDLPATSPTLSSNTRPPSTVVPPQDSNGTVVGTAGGHKQVAVYVVKTLVDSLQLDGAKQQATGSSISTTSRSVLVPCVYAAKKEADSTMTSPLDEQVMKEDREDGNNNSTPRKLRFDLDSAPTAASSGSGDKHKGSNTAPSPISSSGRRAGVRTLDALLGTFNEVLFSTLKNLKEADWKTTRNINKDATDEEEEEHNVLVAISATHLEEEARFEKAIPTVSAGTEGQAEQKTSSPIVRSQYVSNVIDCSSRSACRPRNFTNNPFYGCEVTPTFKSSNSGTARSASSPPRRVSDATTGGVDELAPENELMDQEKQRLGYGTEDGAGSSSGSSGDEADGTPTAADAAPHQHHFDPFITNDSLQSAFHSPTRGHISPRRRASTSSSGAGGAPGAAALHSLDANSQRVLLSLLLPRWSCGQFSQVYSAQEADTVVDDSIRYFMQHESSTKNNSKVGDSLLLQYSVHHLHRNRNQKKTDGGDSGATAEWDSNVLRTTMIYFVLTPVGGSFVCSLRHYLHSDPMSLVDAAVKQQKKAEKAVSTIPPSSLPTRSLTEASTSPSSSPSLAPSLPPPSPSAAALPPPQQQPLPQQLLTKMATSKTVIAHTSRNVLGAFWHPLLDEVISFHVSSFVVIGTADEDKPKTECSPAELLVLDTLRWIRHVLKKKRKELRDDERRLVRERVIAAPLLVPHSRRGGAHQHALQQQQQQQQLPLVRLIPTQKADALEVYQRAQLTMNLAASMLVQFRWLHSILFPGEELPEYLKALLTGAGIHSSAQHSDANATTRGDAPSLLKLGRSGSFFANNDELNSYFDSVGMDLDHAVKKLSKQQQEQQMQHASRISPPPFAVQPDHDERAFSASSPSPIACAVCTTAAVDQQTETNRSASTQTDVQQQRRLQHQTLLDDDEDEAAGGPSPRAAPQQPTPKKKPANPFDIPPSPPPKMGTSPQRGPAAVSREEEAPRRMNLDDDEEMDMAEQSPEMPCDVEQVPVPTAQKRRKPPQNSDDDEDDVELGAGEREFIAIDETELGRQGGGGEGPGDEQPRRFHEADDEEMVGCADGIAPKNHVAAHDDEHDEDHQLDGGEEDDSQAQRIHALEQLVLEMEAEMQRDREEWELDRASLEQQLESNRRDAEDIQELLQREISSLKSDVDRERRLKDAANKAREEMAAENSKNSGTTSLMDAAARCRSLTDDLIWEKSQREALEAELEETKRQHGNEQHDLRNEIAELRVVLHQEQESIRRLRAQQEDQDGSSHHGTPQRTTADGDEAFKSVGIAAAPLVHHACFGIKPDVASRACSPLPLDGSANYTGIMEVGTNTSNDLLQELLVDIKTQRALAQMVHMDAQTDESIYVEAALMGSPTASPRHSTAIGEGDDSDSPHIKEIKRLRQLVSSHDAALQKQILAMDDKLLHQHQQHEELVKKKLQAERARHEKMLEKEKAAFDAHVEEIKGTMDMLQGERDELFTALQTIHKHHKEQKKKQKKESDAAAAAERSASVASVGAMSAVSASQSQEYQLIIQGLREDVKKAKALKDNADDDLREIMAKNMTLKHTVSMLQQELAEAQSAVGNVRKGVQTVTSPTVRSSATRRASGTPASRILSDTNTETASNISAPPTPSNAASGPPPAAAAKRTASNVAQQLQLQKSGSGSTFYPRSRTPTSQSGPVVQRHTLPHHHQATSEVDTSTASNVSVAASCDVEVLEPIRSEEIHRKTAATRPMPAKNSTNATITGNLQQINRPQTNTVLLEGQDPLAYLSDPDPRSLSPARSASHQEANTKPPNEIQRLTPRRRDLADRIVTARRGTK